MSQPLAMGLVMLKYLPIASLLCSDLVQLYTVPSTFVALPILLHSNRCMKRTGVFPNDNGAYRVAAAHPLGLGKNPFFTRRRPQIVPKIAT